MKRIILLATLLTLSGCAQTPEEAAAYRQFGMQMLAQSQAQQQAAMQPMRQTTCTRTFNTVNCLSQ